MRIDLVVPYVDSSDPNWQKLFEQYNPNKHEEGVDAKNRFRGQGDFFKYFFRCVERNANWISKIFLLVQSESQVPKWINREKVNVILHEQFIPQEYLPTFNSTTIEIFLWNIPGLSEYFVYANDDCLFLHPTIPEYFFINGKIKTSTKAFRFNFKMYDYHCLNSYNLAYRKDIFPAEGLVIPALNHIIRPYIKSIMKIGYQYSENFIKERITRFREQKNINIYYFDHFIIKYKMQLPRLELKASMITSTTDSKAIKMILDDVSKHICCIQDTSEDVNVYENFTIQAYFERNYTKKCKYEI